MKTRKPKILCWDTESSGLYADWGRLMCFNYKWLGEPARSVSTLDFPKAFAKNPANDRHVVQAARKILEQADVIITWYGWRHDEPLVRSRLLKHDIPQLPPMNHRDGWWIARKKLKLTSNRLANVAEFLGLPRKTPILKDTWIEAFTGNPRAVKYIIKHGNQDTVVLEKAWLRLRVLDDGVNMALLMDRPDACPRCGALRSLRKSAGARPTRVGWVARYQCRECGGWSQGKVITNKKIKLR